MTEINPFLLQLAALLVGLSKGGLPAIAMLSVPILSLSMSPITAAALLLPIYLLTDLVGVWLYRHDYSAANLRILIPAGLLGILIGWMTASMVSDRIVTVLIGLVGIGFCLNFWFGRSRYREARPVNTAKGLFWGTISGFTSFVAHAGAPPFQIYMLPQRLKKTAFAGTSTILFALINWGKVIPYHALQPYQSAQISASAKLIPVALAGTLLGRYLTGVVPERWYFLIIQILLFCVSVRLVMNLFY